jgi:hypothetical protein
MGHGAQFLLPALCPSSISLRANFMPQKLIQGGAVRHGFGWRRLSELHWHGMKIPESMVASVFVEMLSIVPGTMCDFAGSQYFHTFQDLIKILNHVIAFCIVATQ